MAAPMEITRHAWTVLWGHLQLLLEIAPFAMPALAFLEDISTMWESVLRCVEMDFAFLMRLSAMMEIAEIMMGAVLTVELKKASSAREALLSQGTHALQSLTSELTM